MTRQQSGNSGSRRIENNPVTGEVVDLSHDGRAVIRDENGVVFVAGGLPGEVVSYLPQKKRKGQRQGKLLEVLEPSSHRVTPRCEYFGLCGGCTLQHLAPDQQIALKQKVLFDNLSRLGGVSPQRQLPPLSGADWSYRRKARPGVKLVPKKGGVLVGFREQGSSYLTSLRDCLTLTLNLARLLDPLHGLVAALSCPDRIPQIEMAEGENANALIIRHLEPMTAADLGEIKAFARAQDVQVYLQPGGPNTVAALYPESPDPLTFSLPDFEVTFEFTPLDFVQVNAAVNRQMVSQALELLAPCADDHILDLFCGLGNFTLPIARCGARVAGVEGEAALVDRARANAVRNGLDGPDQASFVAMNLHQDNVTELGADRFNKLLIDPPRSGALEVVTNLVPLIGPDRIVYVSCNPATLARDAGVLVREHGYVLEAAGAINMFPHTAHVESMAVFVRPE